MNAPHATQQQAVACLQAYFHRQVAEAMPAAIRAALQDAQALGHWLQTRTLHGRPCLFGPLDDADIGTLRLLSEPTLLVLLFDQRQPASVVLAARDALLGRYLNDEDVQALAIAAANQMARRAVQSLHATQERQREQLQRAEAQSLYGHEHGVPGVAPVMLSGEQLAAVDDTAGVTR